MNAWLIPTGFVLFAALIACGLFRFITSVLVKPVLPEPEEGFHVLSTERFAKRQHKRDRRKLESKVDRLRWKLRRVFMGSKYLVETRGLKAHNKRLRKLALLEGKGGGKHSRGWRSGPTVFKRKLREIAEDRAWMNEDMVVMKGGRRETMTRRQYFARERAEKHLAHCARQRELRELAANRVPQIEPVKFVSRKVRLAATA